MLLALLNWIAHEFLVISTGLVLGDLFEKARGSRRLCPDGPKCAWPFGIG